MPSCARQTPRSTPRRPASMGSSKTTCCGPGTLRPSASSSHPTHPRGSPVSTDPANTEPAGTEPAATEAWRSPWLDRPGAVEADEPDAGVVAHYGDPVREQRELEAGRAVVDLSHRGVLSLTGPDRLTWLDSISSQSIARLAPGDSAETLILDPQGRIEHSVRIVDDGETA